MKPWIEFLKESEGLRLQPYICTGGALTYGVGHALTKPLKFEDREWIEQVIDGGYFFPITEQDAEYFLRGDLHEALDAVLNEFSIEEWSAFSILAYGMSANQWREVDLGTTPLSPTQAALTELTFNMGTGWFRKFPICVGQIKLAAGARSADRLTYLELAAWNLLHSGKKCEECEGGGGTALSVHTDMVDGGWAECDACFGEGYKPSKWRLDVKEKRAQRVATWLKGSWAEPTEADSQGESRNSLSSCESAEQQGEAKGHE